MHFNSMNEFHDYVALFHCHIRYICTPQREYIEKTDYIEIMYMFVSITQIKEIFNLCKYCN